ncbi:MAG: threonine ammonia-lyase [Promethearchaeota archaeon]
MLTIEDIIKAKEKLQGIANKTPIFTSRTLNKMVGGEIFLKCENFQRTGSLVITHSSGNHAQALALAASLHGVKCVVVMPENAPIVKRVATKDYGAEITFCESTMEARVQTTNNLIEKHDYTLIHPYDNEDIIAGQGTIALELLEDLKNIDVVVAPIGGGGLISGIASVMRELKPDCKVYGVEPSLADDAKRSIKEGKIIPSNYPPTIADGLRTSLCKRTFNIIRKHVDQVVTVEEVEIIQAMKFIWERLKIIVEPSGVVPLAAILFNKIDVKNKKVVLILSGGNIVLDDFFEVLKNKIKGS